MKYTLVDLVRGFHVESKTKNLTAAERSFYLALTGEMNEARFPEWLTRSDKQMAILSGIQSKSTVHDVRNRLKTKNLIDFNVTPRSTDYQLKTGWLANLAGEIALADSEPKRAKAERRPLDKRTTTERLPNDCRTIAERLPNDCRTIAPVPNIRAGEDETRRDETNSERVCACESVDGGGGVVYRGDEPWWAYD